MPYGLNRLAERNQSQPDWLESLAHVVLGGKSLRSLPFGSCPPPRTDTWRWLVEAYCSTWCTSSAVLGLMNALGLLEGLLLKTLSIDCSYPSCPSLKATRLEFSHRTLMTRLPLVSSGLLMLGIQKMFCKRKHEQESFKKTSIVMHRPFSDRRKLYDMVRRDESNTGLRKCFEIKTSINDAKIVRNALNFWGITQN